MNKGDVIDKNLVTTEVTLKEGSSQDLKGLVIDMESIFLESNLKNSSF